MRRYVWRDLVRNPRRTLAATAGVVLGVGLFSAVLFFIDGSGATLTAARDRPARARHAARAHLAARQRPALARAARPGGLDPRREAGHDHAARDQRRGRAGARRRRPGRAAPAAPLSPRHGDPRTARGCHDPGGQQPARQGVAGLGRNIGTVAPGATVTLTYRARASRAVRAQSAATARPHLESREPRAGSARTALSA